jgi:hypothetical protein
VNFGLTAAQRVAWTVSVRAGWPLRNVTRAVTVCRRGPVARSGTATATVRAFAATFTVRTTWPLTEKTTRRTRSTDIVTRADLVPQTVCALMLARAGRATVPATPDAGCCGAGPAAGVAATALPGVGGEAGGGAGGVTGGVAGGVTGGFTGGVVGGWQGGVTGGVQGGVTGGSQGGVTGGGQLAGTFMLGGAGALGY